MLRERKSLIEKKGKITLQTGYGPSGLPHIGTFGEVARTTMMVNALKQLTDIPTEIITFNGFCKEIDNPNSFYFEEEDNWKHQHFGRNAEFLNNRPDELFISYKNIEGDRIDKEIPPNFCKTDYEVDLSSDDVFEDISLTCTREIKGDNGGFIERDYEAVCSIKITERLDCIPDKYFEQNENVPSWINENKYLACSSENIDEYRRQVKARWEQTGD